MLWNHSDLLRFRFRLWASFGSGSGSRQYLAHCSNNKNLEKILPFQCQNQHYSPESRPLIFDFLTFYSILFRIRIQIRFRNRIRNWNRSIPVPGPLRQKVIVPAVKVPVPQHWAKPMDMRGSYCRRTSDVLNYSSGTVAVDQSNGTVILLSVPWTQNTKDYRAINCLILIFSSSTLSCGTFFSSCHWSFRFLAWKMWFIFSSCCTSCFIFTNPSFFDLALLSLLGTSKAFSFNHFFYFIPFSTFFSFPSVCSIMNEWMNEWMNERTFYWYFYSLGPTVLATRLKKKVRE